MKKFLQALFVTISISIFHYTQSIAQDNVVQEHRYSTVHISSESPKGGIRSGTGFVVSEDGHVLTAWHVVRDWVNSNQSHQQKKPLIATRGSHLKTSPSYTLTFLGRAQDDVDFAVLKILGENYGSGSVPTCIPPNNIDGRIVSIGGFPNGGAFQRVDGIMGDLIEGGRYSFASNVVSGMSGGPVFDKKYKSVIGLLSSGSGGPATKRMVPMNFGKSLLTNFNIEIPNCESSTQAISGKTDLEIKYSGEPLKFEIYNGSSESVELKSLAAQVVVSLPVEGEEDRFTKNRVVVVRTIDLAPLEYISTNKQISPITSFWEKKDKTISIFPTINFEGGVGYLLYVRDQLAEELGKEKISQKTGPLPYNLVGKENTAIQYCEGFDDTSPLLTSLPPSNSKPEDASYFVPFICKISFSFENKNNNSDIPVDCRNKAMGQIISMYGVTFDTCKDINKFVSEKSQGTAQP